MGRFSAVHLLLLAIVVSGCANSNSRDAVAPGPEAPTIYVEGGPTGLAVSQGIVWVAYGQDSVARIDAKTNQIVTRVKVGRDPVGLAIARGSVWVTNRVDGTVSRIDEQTHSVVATIPVGKGPFMIAASDDAIWVANSGSGDVSKIDPQTNRTTATIPIGIDAVGIAVDANSVWVTEPKGHKVVQIDAASNQIVGKPIAVGPRPECVAVSASAVWVASASGVSRIDPRTHQVVATIPIDGSPVCPVIVGDAVWVSLFKRASIVKIDARTNSVIGAPIRVAQSPAEMAVGEGAIWVSSGFASRVSRVPLQ